MKNKSKQSNQPAMPAEWLYINDKELSLSDLKEAFEKRGDVTVQIWQELGVAELEIAEGKSIDLEQAGSLEEYEDALLSSHNARTLFFVTIAPQDFAKSKPIMEYMTERLGGFFCGNTDDFMPILP